MLKVIKTGFFTTLQDRGRFGYRNQGVPVSGVMDGHSATQVNNLLENNPNDALLEVCMTGPVLEFEADTAICTGGAIFEIKLNDRPVTNLEVVSVRKGDVLTYGRLIKGFRSYLGIKGGIRSEMILGSQSYYVPITKTAAIAQNEVLNYQEITGFEPKISKAQIDTVLNEKALMVEKGPEYDRLTPEQLELLFKHSFTIAKENNRMAYQLVEPLMGHTLSMLTSSTMPGTVQLTPSGKLIILMRDGQTTGGYPRILQMTERSVCALAQKKTGDKIAFQIL